MDNSSPLISSKDLDLIRVILRDHGYERALVKPGGTVDRSLQPDRSPAQLGPLLWGHSSVAE